MKMKKTRNRSPLGLLTKILVVITVIAILTAVFRIRDYTRDYSYTYSESNYVWDLQGDRFGDIYSTAVRDMSKGKSYSKDVEECRALAFYYEQAVLEKAYRDNGFEEKADAFAEKKAEYADQLGSLASKAKSVEAQLEN